MSSPSASHESDSDDSMWVRRLTFGKVNKINVKVEEEWGAGIGGFCMCSMQ